MKTQTAPHNRALATALCFELSADVPEWVEVLPPGPQIVGRDGRAWNYDAAEVMANTLAHAQGADLPFDYLHATELKAPKGEEAPAAGWAREYRINERGALEARVEWTDDGRADIAARRYRYLSPVFIYDGAGRIHYFSSFGLTNKPNLTIRALNSEQFPYPDHQPTEESDMALAAILAALGMPEAATEQQAVAFINQLRGDLNTAQNSERAPSLQKFVPRADYDALEQRAVNAEQKLKQREADELATAINSEIEAALAAGKITPATKDYHVAACQEKGGLDRFRDFVKAAPSVTEPVVPEAKPGEAKALNAEQQQAARMLGMSDEQYIKHIEGVH